MAFADRRVKVKEAVIVIRASARPPSVMREASLDPDAAAGFPSVCSCNLHTSLLESAFAALVGDSTHLGVFVDPSASGIC